MTHVLLPAHDQIKAVCGEEIGTFGGEVIETFDHGAFLFLRAVLPQVQSVRPDDSVQGGIAVRTCGPAILVHPYTFRQICRNGAIRAQALQTRRIERVEKSATPHEAASSYAVQEVLNQLHSAIQSCCAPEVFAVSVEQMRSAAEQDADTALAMLPMLRFFQTSHNSNLLNEILRRFESGGDHTRFGLMNAVTSLARDTANPETRWRLEELGGTVPALRRPVAPKPTPARAEAVMV